MQTFTHDQVLAELRSQCAPPSSIAETAGSLGVTRALISLVLSGKRDISEGLALRLGFVKLPDSYVRAPKKAKR